MYGRWCQVVIAVREMSCAARAPCGGTGASFSKSMAVSPAGSRPNMRRMSGMRRSGTPQPIMTWQLGMLTCDIISDTGCSTCECRIDAEMLKTNVAVALSILEKIMGVIRDVVLQHIEAGEDR